MCRKKFAQMIGKSNLSKIIVSLGMIKPIGSVNDETKLIVDFRAKVKSDKHPDAGISMSAQLVEQAKWSHDTSSDKRKELQKRNQFKALSS